MARRETTGRVLNKTEILGSPKLTFAYVLVLTEKILQVFARPLLIAGAFMALAWLNVFSGLYPWAHLIALILFVAAFFDALGRAGAIWQPVPRALGRRRLERASNLAHRPLDVLDDRAVGHNDETLALWQAHKTHSLRVTQNLHWPKWVPVLADRDPYALRYGLLILLTASLVAGWGSLGGRLVAAINPALGKLQMAAPTLDAWITPPEYTGLPPMMIGTPAGLRGLGGAVQVPEGSTLVAHIMEQGGSTPRLHANGDVVKFITDDHGDYEASAVIEEGDSVAISRGWQDIASWRIAIIADQPPTITFSAAPTVTERKALRLAYKANDDYGVMEVKARVTPRESMAGVNNDPIEFSLASGPAKEIERVSFLDLTSHPWSGMPVDIQLVATDAAGHSVVSDAQQLILPEREFFQPVARALIDQRRKLLQAPFDDNVRNQTANLMAGVAQQPAVYHGDAVVLMALRAGAVRLILNHDGDSVPSVATIIWEAAVRIEDGVTGTAENNLREAQKELADALDRNASDEEVGRLIDRLHQALAQYLAELSTRVAARPGPLEDLSPLMGERTNMLTPQDLQNMLEHMRDLSASGDRDAARKELAQMQNMLENLRTGPQQLSAQQKQDLQNLKALHELTRDQRALLDKTFQDSQSGKGNPNDLAKEENGLLDRLNALMQKMKTGNEGKQGEGAMQDARDALRLGAASPAMAAQGKALKALEQAERNAVESMREKMLALGQGEEPGQGNDPFGRRGASISDDGTVKVPAQLQAKRVREILDELHKRAGNMDSPKAEHDYIDRLLQNF